MSIVKTRNTVDASRTAAITVQDLYDTFERLEISKDVQLLFEELGVRSLALFLFLESSDFQETFLKPGVGADAQATRETLRKGDRRLLTAFHKWCRHQRYIDSLTLDILQRVTGEVVALGIAIPVVQPSPTVATSPVVVMEPKRPSSPPPPLANFSKIQVNDRRQWDDFYQQLVRYLTQKQ